VVLMPWTSVEQKGALSPFEKYVQSKAHYPWSGHLPCFLNE
jgi:hypothetical protein